MPRLFLSTDFRTAWNGVYAPWFDVNRLGLVRGAKASVVLVPSLSFAHALRGLLARDGVALAGIHFWTPNDARRFLVGHCGGGRVADRETIHLLLSSAAASAFQAHPDWVSAAAVSREPEALAQSLDRLADAGWNFDELGNDELREVGRSFAELLTSNGLGLVQDRDFASANACRNSPVKAFQSVLVAGFHGSHWPDWPVLEAMAHLADEVVISARQPRNDGVGLDEIWINSWELIAGSPEMLSSDRLVQDNPCYAYAEALWTGTTPAPTVMSPLRALVATDLHGQARAAVLQAKAWLGTPGADRIGIFVPSIGALAREVASAFEAEGILFWNDLGTPCPGFCEGAAWRAFMAFLAHPTAESLQSVFDAGAKPPVLSGSVFKRSRQLLRGARVSSFSEKLSHLSDVISAAPDAASKEFGEFLKSLPLLPEESTLGEFTALFLTLLDQWGWSENRSLWERETSAVDLSAVKISRVAFLRWVKEHGQTMSRYAGESGNHPYAKVVLTSYIRADGQPWSHAICLGLNEGHFPPPYSDSAFLGEDTIRKLNARVQRLNDSSLTTDEGAGQTVLPNHGLLLGPVEERWSMQQALVGVLEQAESATVMISLSDETNPGMPLRPGEYFIRLAEAVTGMLVTEERLASIAKSFRADDIAALAVDAVRHAYDERRNEHAPFNEFSFAFKKGHVANIHLGASSWESMLSYPAQNWARAALRIYFENENSDLPWSQTEGVWAHAWLSHGHAGNAVCAGRKADHFTSCVLSGSAAHLRSAADRFKCSVDALPRWWMAAYVVARRMALRLAKALDQVCPDKWPAFVMEYELPKGIEARVGDVSITTGGRIDLIFFDRAGGSVIDILKSGGSAWLIDFKTGKHSRLSAKKLAAGDGMQLGLNALALQQLNAKDVALTLQKPGDDLVQQLSLADVTNQIPLWTWVSGLQATGIFGQLEQVRGEFSRGACFPLATLPIPQHVLESKWALTHPAP